MYNRERTLGQGRTKSFGEESFPKQRPVRDPATSLVVSASLLEQGMERRPPFSLYNILNGLHGGMMHFLACHGWLLHSFQKISCLRTCCV